jgi:tRNA modification GTPase
LNAADTIAAISSAVGRAPRVIVRVSGPLAIRMGAELTRSSVDALRSGSAHHARLDFSNLSVPAWVYVFRAPRSYTGEDLVEFHLSGNPLLARLLLDHLRAAGARPADPGEFTARAFFNGRLDLAGAEGVAATIAAGSERELAAARQLMAGELARRLRPAMDALAETLALVEAGIDFSDEDVTFLTPEQVRQRVATVEDLLRRLLDDSTRFERLAQEPTVVLVGRPNAGKSTLLNALAGRDRAVTSPVAGTTRDVLAAEVALRRGIVRVMDAAGLDDVRLGANESPVEGQMREQALRAVEVADVIVLVQDVTDPRPPLAASRTPDVVVRTKADLLGDPATGVATPDTLPVSAVTGFNVGALRGHLDLLAFGAQAPSAGSTLALNARHVEAVREAREALARASDRAADASPEVVALELREALDAAGRVLGAVTPDDLLGRIFSTFCVGK